MGTFPDPYHAEIFQQKYIALFYTFMAGLTQSTGCCKSPAWSIKRWMLQQCFSINNITQKNHTGKENRIQCHISRP
jgi:hypothetical protein